MTRIAWDDRLRRAALCALREDLDGALELLSDLPARHPSQVKGKKESSSEQEEEECRALQHTLLREFLEPSPSDPYDLVTNLIVKHQESHDGGDPLSAVIWQRIFARYAAREGYPAAAGFVLEKARTYLEYAVQNPQRMSLTSPKGDLADINEELSHIRAKPLDAPGSASGEARRSDPVSPTVARLLAASRIRVFEERRPERKPSRPKMSEEEVDGATRRALARLSLPDGFSALRAEKCGEEAIAIGVSQDYDPVGEFSRGAYWVIRSHDAGKTWDRPLHTGLRIQAPYVVVPISSVPLLAEERLVVEVDIRELDETSITFPPIALRAKREEKGLLLETRIEELVRDSDEDGLTDLAEERLILDPRDPDTDDDGIGDATDLLPQVPWSGDPDPIAGALASVLGEITGGALRPIIHEIASEPGDPDMGLDDFLKRTHSATLTDERTTFWVGERSAFRGLLPENRMVVLKEEELELARSKFGPMYPGRILLLLIDREQRHGLAIWDEDWRGGTLRLDRSNGVWKAFPVSYWIT